MKIRRLRIENFRGLQLVDLKGIPDKLMIVGHTGAGKSTILDAARLILLGTIRDANGVRIVNSDMLSNDKDVPAVILAEFDTGHEATLTISEKGEQELKIKKDGKLLYTRERGPREVRRAFISDYFREIQRPELDDRHLSAALEPRSYLLGNEVGQLLAELVVPKFSMKDLATYAGDHWDWFGPWLQAQIKGNKDPDLEAIGTFCEEEAKRIRLEIRRLNVELEPLSDATPVEVDGKLISESQLPKIRKELEGLEQQRRAAMALIEQRKRWDEQLASVPDYKKQLADEIDAHSTTEESFKIAMQLRDASHKKCKDCSEQAEQAQKEWEAAMESMDECERTMIALQQTNCPECGRAYDNLDDIKDKLLAATDKFKEAEHIFEAKSQELKRLEDEAKNLQDDFNRESQAARMLDNSLRSHLGRLEMLENTISALEGALEKVYPKSQEALQEDAATLEARIVKGRAIIAPLEAYAKKEALTKELHKQQDLLSRIQWGVASFRDGGFINSQLGSAKEEWESRCNQHLAPFGYSMKLKVDGKNVSVLLRHEYTKAWVPVTQTSRGEQLLAEWAVAMAFEPPTTVFLDNLESVSSKHRPHFIKELEELTYPAWAVSTWTNPGSRDAAKPLAGHLKDAKVVWVENGTAQILEDK